jgi:hypothetical protein
LSELALSCPEAFGNHGETIIEFVTKKVLHAECSASDVSPAISTLKVWAVLT